PSVSKSLIRPPKGFFRLATVARPARLAGESAIPCCNLTFRGFQPVGVRNAGAIRKSCESTETHVNTNRGADWEFCGSGAKFARNRDLPLRTEALYRALLGSSLKHPVSLEPHASNPWQANRVALNGEITTIGGQGVVAVSGFETREAGLLTAFD